MNYVGLFAHLFGVRPWEWEMLTVSETAQLEREADAWVKSNKADS